MAQLIDDLMAATDGGLQIILDYYPQAKDCAGTTKKFKLRSDERTASASIRKKGDRWKVTDFGGTGHEMDAIDICKYEEHIEYNSEAISLLAQRYGVASELKPDINKPDFEQRASKPEEEPGQTYLKFADSFTPDQLRVLGPLVTEEHCRDLHWFPVKSILYVKDRVTTIISANDRYPIFARQCVFTKDGKEDSFYKVYQPYYIGKDGDKSRRFTYTPAGKKPARYTNGLAELKRTHHIYNEQERKEWESSHKENEPYKEKKLKEAFICSGERDALCIKSLGYCPIWFNSETYTISVEEYKEIMKYVEVLYNIPDLDDTGRTRGKELALRFIDIHTIWLPERLGNFKDHRGHARKDFRDYIEIYKDKGNIRDLMTLAMPAKFWSSKPNSKGTGYTHDIDTECLHYFLGLNGFCTLHDENSANVRYIRIEGNVVKQVTPKDIAEFLRKWAKERALPREIRNLILNSQRLNTSSLDRLQEVDLDFTDYTATKQIFFFPNETLEITGSGIIEHKGTSASLANYVWEENVIKCPYKKLDDFFSITLGRDEDGNMTYNIQLHDVERSPFLCFLINTSRVHWRKELEDNLEKMEVQEREAYKTAHKFDIAGEGLTQEEIAEQMQNLINKIFVIGYMMHRYKSPSRPWAPMAMDNKIGEDNQCNGRSGKSFIFKALSYFRKTVKLSGRNVELTKNPHWLDQVNKHTDMLIVDDCDRYLQLGPFYDIITSDMTINPKNNQSFTVPFEDSPKLVFTTNYVPDNFDPSTEARLLYLINSDYYHERTEDNDYKESRSIRDDFGFDLFSKTYGDERWNADINFILQATRFYLSLCSQSVKIQPPMGNIIKRKYLQDMGTLFADWATAYFAPESEHLDKMLIRERVYEDYKRSTGSQKATVQSFTKRLKSFVQSASHIADYNPKEFQNGQGRIIRRPETDTPQYPKDKPVEMIYIRTVEGAKHAAESSAKEGSLGDDNEEWEDGRPF